jgi:hypothetical protein
LSWPLLLYTSEFPAVVVTIFPPAGGFTLPGSLTEAEEVEPVGVPVFGLFGVMVPWALD